MAITDEPLDDSARCEHCGAELAYLNEASDDPRCTDCGYAEELCRCAPKA